MACFRRGNSRACESTYRGRRRRGLSLDKASLIAGLKDGIGVVAAARVGYEARAGGVALLVGQKGAASGRLINADARGLLDVGDGLLGLDAQVDALAARVEGQSLACDLAGGLRVAAFVDGGRLGSQDRSGKGQNGGDGVLHCDGGGKLMSFLVESSDNL